MGEQPCKETSKDLLKKGDHICSDRLNGIFYHHGIYFGHGLVIHLKGPRKGTGKFISSSSAMKSSSSSGWKSACPFSRQRFQNSIEGGIVITCVDCFLDGHSLYVYDYKCSAVSWYVEEQMSSVKSPQDVVDLAYGELYGNNIFGGYDLLDRNCEHFGTYCKTGVAFSMQSLWVRATRKIISPWLKHFGF
ncbi:hypothetical protein Pint_20450 [Pistacia integerrima]|uniref:Uncharacterized protein n=1 Tax=Pistacia integerrima TaxID=434235 RepID=A0ACC0XCP9_9ROSI|nr:hypothetical protein Pint_20450 [Pistacia integerrima]